MATAITAVSTALLGLAYSYKVAYESLIIVFLWWHRFLGISTVILAIITTILKELEVKGKVRKKTYVISLIVLVICVTITGLFGGEMTFGLFHLPPYPNI